MTKKQPDPLIFILIGGALFLCVAVGLFIRVLTAPQAEIVAVVPSPTLAEAPTPTNVPPTNASPSAKMQDAPAPSATPADAPASTTSPTDTPAPGGGDQLLLPTSTSTPAPPTATPTSTSTPTNTSVPAPRQRTEGVGIGNIAPDFTLGSNRASRVSLSDLRGKIVILNFWASWCPPCQREVPDLQAVHDEYGPQGVVVLAVNQGEKLEDVGRFANNNGIHFAVWLDEDEWAGSIYGVRSIPTTYFIDREGVIRAVQFGTMTREQIVGQLKKIL